MTIEKFVDVAGELIRRAAESMTVEGTTVDDVSSREAFTRSVENWLPIVVATLKTAGLVHGATGRRRPRRFDERTWELLDGAEKQVGVARVVLVRCCLQLQAEHADSTRQFIRSLSGQVREAEAEIREEIEPDE